MESLNTLIIDRKYEVLLIDLYRSTVISVPKRDIPELCRELLATIDKKEEDDEHKAVF